MKPEDQPSIPPPSRRATLPTPKEWETLDATKQDRILAELEREEKHRRRMEVAEWVARVFGQVCGLSTVLVLALLSKHFVDQGAATQGAAIIITGAVAIVTVFVTGRISQRRQPRGVLAEPAAASATSQSPIS